MADFYDDLLKIDGVDEPIADAVVELVAKESRRENPYLPDDYNPK